MGRFTTRLTVLRAPPGALLSTGFALLAAIGPASAEDAPGKQLPSKGEIETKLQSDVADITAEREKLNALLVETAGLIQKSEARMTAIEARIGELEVQEKLVRGSLNQRNEHIAKLLSALQRMGRNPPPVMIARREDALKMVRSAMLLAAAFPSMRDQALNLADQLKELTRVMAEQQTEADRLKAETAQLSDRRLKLAGLLETKKQSLAGRQAELVQVRQAAAQISRSVNDLNELIAKVDEAVSKRTSLAAYEEEAKRPAESPLPPSQLVAGTQTKSPPEAQDGAPGANPKPSEVAALVPPHSPKTVIELAPAGTSLVPGNPGRIKPAIAFQLAKAKLPVPAQGRRVLSFGEKTQYGATSKGLVIETRAGAQVTSPCDGWIVYAGEFRSYGQLLIINAGGGYHVLVAGLSQIDVQPGQFVLAAEPVGTMSGATKSGQDGAQPGAPVLYVEFRKDGHPIDPDPWWAENHQKVQG